MLTSEKKTSKLTMRKIMLNGSILAIVITAPSIMAFFLSWMILDDLIQAVIVGALIHFLAMGFSLKISKKLLIQND